MSPTGLFDTDTLALLLTIFILYSNTIKRRRWCMNISVNPSSLLVVPVKEKTTSTRLGRLGEVCDMTTRATPGRGIEQLPYFLSFEIIAFIPMALGFSLALVLLTRYLMARTDPYSPFFLGSAMCMAFPVILSAWRNTARSSNSNQVLSFLLALTITPIASFNTSRLFGVDTPRSNIPLSSFQQALLVDLGLQDYLPILRGITYMLLYIGLLLAVYTIVEPSIRSTDILNAWIRGGQTAHIREAACNSVCREVPSEDTLDSIRGGAVAMTRDWILRYFGLLSPMVIPLLFAPSTSPLSVAQHSAIPTLPDFITWGIAISIIDITTYGTLRGMVQYWLLNGDQETSPDRLERDTRYMRTMYTAFECAIVPRLITIFMDIDLMLRMIPTILGIRLVDDSIVDLSSILPIIPSRTDINYSQLVPRLRRVISELWCILLPPVEVMKWSKIYIGTLILAWAMLRCGTLLYRSFSPIQTGSNRKMKWK